MPLPLPPVVGSPIYASRPGQVPVPEVYVQNVLAGSAVTVYAQPQGSSAPPVAVSAATPVPKGGNIWVALTQLGAQGLTAKSRVTAVQVNAGQTSGTSNQVVVLAVPKLVPKPQFLSRLSACMSAVRMGNLIPGATLHVRNAQNEPVLQQPVTEAIGGVQVFALSSGASTPANGALTAWQQTFEGGSSEKTTSPLVAAALPLTTPVIAPVWPCETGLFLSNLTPGSNLKIENDGNESDYANTYDTLDPLLLVAPLKEGTEVTVEQYYSRCPATASHTAHASVSATPKPLPALKIGYAPGNDQSLLVSDVLPGETLSVSADVTGTGTQLLGEQPVTYVPATVNLPSYPGAFSPNGPAVSVSVKATMCDNQAANASADPAQPPQGLGGFNQYVFSSPNPQRAGSGIPLLGVKVKIEIIEDLILAEGSAPLTFQINGFSPSTEPTGPASVSWQQFGIQMQPGSRQVVSFTENWPLAYNTNNSAQNLFNLTSPNSVNLPNDTTIPAGWTFDFALQYQPDGSSLIKGFTCAVSDRGQLLKHLDFAYLNQPLAAGYISEFQLPSGHTTVEPSDLASLVAFQVVIVGYPERSGSTLASGVGKITCSASTPLTPSIPWPPFSSGSNGSAEEANTTYSLVAAAPSTTIVQLFGVSS